VRAWHEDRKLHEEAVSAWKVYSQRLESELEAIALTSPTADTTYDQEAGGANSLVASENELPQLKRECRRHQKVAEGLRLRLKDAQSGQATSQSESLGVQQTALAELQLTKAREELALIQADKEAAKRELQEVNLSLATARQAQQAEMSGAVDQRAATQQVMARTGAQLAEMHAKLRQVSRERDSCVDQMRNAQSALSALAQASIRDTVVVDQLERKLSKLESDHRAHVTALTVREREGHAQNEVIQTLKLQCEAQTVAMAEVKREAARQKQAHEDAVWSLEHDLEAAKESYEDAVLLWQRDRHAHAEAALALNLELDASKQLHAEAVTGWQQGKQALDDARAALELERSSNKQILMEISTRREKDEAYLAAAGVKLHEVGLQLADLKSSEATQKEAGCMLRQSASESSASAAEAQTQVYALQEKLDALATKCAKGEAASDASCKMILTLKSRLSEVTAQGESANQVSAKLISSLKKQLRELTFEGESASLTHKETIKSLEDRVDQATTQLALVLDAANEDHKKIQRLEEKLTASEEQLTNAHDLAEITKQEHARALGESRLQVSFANSQLVLATDTSAANGKKLVESEKKVCELEAKVSSLRLKAVRGLRNCARSQDPGVLNRVLL